MTAPTPPTTSALPQPRLSPLGGWLGAALIAIAVLLAWSNSLHGPFVLDDGPAIVDNASIRQWSTALNPPNNGETVTGRPLVNLSFALNHALAAKGPPAPETPTLPGPDSVLGYHVFNLSVHLGAALALFGLVRRALQGPVLGSKFANPTKFNLTTGDVLAFFIALLWAVHPLQTGAVTYIAQRAESMCALFYLLTLYCLARGANSTRAWGWLTAGVTTCLLGMATKEVMVSAPLLALLIDRAFFAGSFSEAFRRRWGFYVGLVTTWILLAGLAMHAGKRGASAGFGLQDPQGILITPWTYLLKQCEAIVQYLRLAFWPDRLVSDYGFDVIGHASEVWSQGLLLIGLFGGACRALWKRPGWGVTGLWFFAILAPSSSFIPVITETAAEHRMYLPLISVVVAVVLGGYALARRGGSAGTTLAVCFGFALAAALGAVTHHRNLDYRSAANLWRDAATKRPQNARAHQELAQALAKDPARREEAFAEYREALRLIPNYPTALNNYGTALAEAGRHADAIAQFQQAVRLKPELAEAWLGLGNALANLGRFADAAQAFQNALKLRPDMVIAANNLGRALDSLGRADEALAVLQKVVAENPGYALGRMTLANFLGMHGRPDDAITHYRVLLQLNPRDEMAAVNLGVAYFLAGRKAEAIAQLEAVLRADPGNTDVQNKLATIRASTP